MTDLRKAAEMALEALNEVTGWQWSGPMRVMDEVEDAIQALRQALAQPEQEPVAWLHELADGHRYCVTKDESGYVDNFTDTYKTIPLYTAPPKREHLERLCRIMGTFDLATGHADTMEQALDALESELRDVLGYLRAKREWVGLTDEEFEQAVDGLEDLRDCWIQIEAKLKEKNA